MKDTHFLYGVAILAVIGIITVFVAYATDMLPMSASVTKTRSKITKPKKNCSCCSDKMNKVLEKIKKDKGTNKNIDEVWVELVEDL